MRRFAGIRPALPDDIPAIRSIHRRCISVNARGWYSPDIIKAWRRSLTVAFYRKIIALHAVVAEDDGIIGFGILDGKSRIIHAVYVDPRVQGQGTGAAILRSLMCAVKRGSRVRLNASLNAVGFYLHSGFAEVRQSVMTLPDGTDIPCVEMERKVVRR